QKAEAERKAREEVERKQAIAAMSPVDKAMAECLDARVDKNQPEFSALLAGLKNGMWPDDIAIGVARVLKDRMVVEKKWVEKSLKKNPHKDKDYLNTLLIMDYLKKSMGSGA
ncbi:MAG: hypothetical protein GX772_04075, partial [Alcaligenaceae bacterium]|nr:hypothetical protein [Alcaligenaceae bacterium]